MTMAGILTQLIKRAKAMIHAGFSDGGVDMAYPPGHFYNPVPLVTDIRRREKQIFRPWPTEIPGVDLNADGQFALLETLATHYPEMPFQHTRADGARYGFDNPFFCQSDAIFLYSMIRHWQPKRIIEVGSGHSSAVMLDTVDRFAAGEVQLTFIEPYPERLRSLLTTADEANGNVRVVAEPVQAVPMAVFEALDAGDILFVDSSHVVKTGSDVAHILFEVLPRLKTGVIVHFHDVFYPFEYPKEWVLGGRCWNEDYFLRAFLTGNEQFEIIAFNTYLAHMHQAWFAEHMPLCLENPGGSLWLQKRGPALVM